MANTFTVDTNIVMGNKRVLIGTYTMTDGGGGAATASGLRNIDYISITPNSSATGMSGLQINSAASSTQGEFNISSAASADTFELMIVGD